MISAGMSRLITLEMMRDSQDYILRTLGKAAKVQIFSTLSTAFDSSYHDILRLRFDEILLEARR